MQVRKSSCNKTRGKKSSWVKYQLMSRRTWCGTTVTLQQIQSSLYCCQEQALDCSVRQHSCCCIMCQTHWMVSNKTKRKFFCLICLFSVIHRELLHQRWCIWIRFSLNLWSFLLHATGKFYCKPHYCYRLSGYAQRKRPAPSPAPITAQVISFWFDSKDT